MAAGRFGEDALERNHDGVCPGPDRIVTTYLLIRTMTLGIVGDLCYEVQMIFMRIQSIRCGLDRSQDLGLIARLQAEMDSYVERCLEIRDSLKLMQYYLCKESLQVSLLEELLNRCLMQQKINCLD